MFRPVEFRCGGLRRLRRGALSYGQVGRGRVCRVTAVAIRLDEARRVVLWRSSSGALGSVLVRVRRLC